MTGPTSSRLTGVAAAVLAVGIALSMALVVWLGYRALEQWRGTAASLARSRANETVNLLGTALLRDMRGVQESVLSSARLYDFVLQPSHDARSEAASAFARYPYPESFFVWRHGGPPESVTFFNRGERRPSWVPGADDAPRAPVVIESGPDIAQRLLDRIRVDVAQRRRVSAFELSIDGTPYQVVAQIVYRDIVREQLEAVVGFTVNLAWVREHYFPEITEQVARIAGAGGGASLAVMDEHGARVAGVVARPDTPTLRRPFSLLFLDPLLVASDPPPDLPRTPWAIEVAVDGDAALSAATRIATRTLALAALAAVALTLGLVLTVRAVRASAQLGEMRSEFVSTVTHELKTPIASIRAIGDTMVSGRASGETLVECTHLLVQESKRLTRLVDNLLAYSRITDLTDAYLFEPLPVSTLVADVLEGFGWQLRDQGFAVTVDVAPDLPPVRGDRTALRLALDNVVDNAIRYSGPVKALNVIARGADDTVVLEITDRGIGIPQDELALVTRRFFRGRGAKAGGSGLGLTIAHRIVTDHVGTLALFSAPGGGTTVRISLPQARGEHG